MTVMTQYIQLGLQGGQQGTEYVITSKLTHLIGKVVWVAYLCTLGIGEEKGVSNGLKNVYTEKVTPFYPMLIMELFMKTPIVLQQQGCFFTSSMLLSPIGSSEHSQYIQYLSRDLWKISVLSRCGLRLMNSKIWTFTSILECEW